LVVGGNLSASNGNVYEGSIDVGGTYSGPGYNINSASGSAVNSHLGSSGLPISFSAAFATLDSNSLVYGSEAANGSSVLQYSTLTLTGTNSSLDIFDISGSTLASASTVDIDAPSGAQVLINVSGTSDSMSNTGFGGTFNSDTNTLFNFYQATSLSLSGVGIDGSVLAPLANVTFNSGQLNGQLIAATFSGYGELHEENFNNQVIRVSVPESASTAELFGAALVAGACWEKFKSRSRARA